MYPRDFSRTESKFEGESRLARLPLRYLCLSLATLLVVPLLTLVPVAAQETSPPPSGQPASGQTGQPGAPASTPATPLGPDGRPYVPPSPPGPSQTRIPGAFDMSVIPLNAPRLSFSSGVSLSEQWTDNFRLTQRERVENFRTILTGSLTTLLNYPNTQGSLSGSLSGTYDTASDQDHYSFFPSFTGTLQHTFNPRMKLVVSDTYIRDDDPALSDPNGASLRGERREFSVNNFSVSLNWLLDIIQTQIYYRNSFFIDNEQTMSHIFGARASMPVGALNSVSLGYEFTTRDTSGDDTGQTMVHRVFGTVSRQLDTFTSAGVSSSLSMVFSDTDSRIWNVSLFAAHGVPGGFSLSGSVGYSIFDSDAASSLRHTFSASINASYRFAYATISAGFFQDFRQTADEGEDFGIVLTRTAYVGFSYAITPFVSASLRGRYTHSEAVNGGGSGIAPQTTYSAGASVNWRILTWLSLSASYSWTKRDVDNNGRRNTGTDPDAINENSTENRATVTLSAHF